MLDAFSHPLRSLVVRARGIAVALNVKAVGSCLLRLVIAPHAGNCGVLNDTVTLGKRR